LQQDAAVSGDGFHEASNRAYGPPGDEIGNLRAAYAHGGRASPDLIGFDQTDVSARCDDFQQYQNELALKVGNVYLDRIEQVIEKWCGDNTGRSDYVKIAGLAPENDFSGLLFVSLHCTP
jgi:hypothetical protein